MPPRKTTTKERVAPRKRGPETTTSASTADSSAAPGGQSTDVAPSTSARAQRTRRGGQVLDRDQAEVTSNEEEGIEPPTGKEDDNAGFESFFPALQLEDYHKQLDKWPLARLKKALADAKNPRRNRLPPAIAAAVAGQVRDREKMVLMLALIGGCREGLIRKEMLMKRPAKKSGACNRFYRYGKKALAIHLPRSTDKSGWKLRNKAVARLWVEFTDEQKQVFKDPYFWALAGLPDPDQWMVDDDDDWEDEEDEPTGPILDDLEDVNEAEGQHDDDAEDTPAQVAKASAVIASPPVHQLSAEDEQRLRPIFNELVDHARIELNYGKAATGPSVNNLVAKGQAAFKQAHAHLAHVAYQYNIAYYLSAATAEAPVAADIRQWALVWSTSEAFAIYAERGLNLSQQFLTHVRGKAMNTLMDDTNKMPEKALPPSTQLKAKCIKVLNDLLSTCVGKPSVFPKGQNPTLLLQEGGFGCEVIREKTCTLSDQDYERGFVLMNAPERAQWLADIDAGDYRLKKLPENQIQPKKVKPRKRRRVEVTIEDVEEEIAGMSENNGDGGEEGAVAGPSENPAEGHRGGEEGTVAGPSNDPAGDEGGA